MKIRFFLFTLGLLAASASADNPIIAGQGVSDPHIHVYEGKAYLFADHDYSPTNKWYNQLDWWVWSSPDLIHWKKEFTLLPQDTYAGATNQCWATDGAARNGKYYFYFSRASKDAGVAVSTNGPGGPYKDVLGKALGKHDVTVFVDDDPAHTPYYIGGKFPYYISKMNDDMISMAETPRIVTYSDATNAWRPTDGNFLHKHNGIYYLNQHSSKYGTSTNIYGPYTYRGLYGSPKEDHGTFFTWSNQTYNAFGLADVSTHYRKVHITYAAYKDNGDLVTDPFIATNSLGVGQYDAAWHPIHADWYFAASDGISKNEADSGFELRNLVNGSFLIYPNVRNMSHNTPVSFRVSSGHKGGACIDVRQNSPDGTLLGSCTVPDTGGWTNYQTVGCNLTNEAGTNSICLVFKGGSGEIMRLLSFEFPHN
jgi:hypothetical protein